MSGTRKVLVAEDSSVIQNLTKKILQFQDFEISSVKNGQQVLDKIKGEDFDVILMDINMPVMDGMQCAREIRNMSNPDKSQIPIIAISGNAKNYTMEDFKGAGFNDYLPKPLDFDKLVETVKRYSEHEY